MAVHSVPLSTVPVSKRLLSQYQSSDMPCHQQSLSSDYGTLPWACKQLPEAWTVSPCSATHSCRIIRTTMAKAIILHVLWVIKLVLWENHFKLHLSVQALRRARQKRCCSSRTGRVSLKFGTSLHVRCVTWPSIPLPSFFAQGP